MGTLNDRSVGQKLYATIKDKVNAFLAQLKQDAKVYVAAARQIMDHMNPLTGEKLATPVVSTSRISVEFRGYIPGPSSELPEGEVVQSAVGMFNTKNPNFNNSSRGWRSCWMTGSVEDFVAQGILTQAQADEALKGIAFIGQPAKCNQTGKVFVLQLKESLIAPTNENSENFSKKRNGATGELLTSNGQPIYQTVTLGVVTEGTIVKHHRVGLDIVGERNNVAVTIADKRAAQAAALAELLAKS